MGGQSVAAFSHFFCHAAARNSDADSVVEYLEVARALRGRGFMHRWNAGLAAMKPAYRKRYRRVHSAERKARLRERSIAAGLSRSKRSARTTTLPLDIGPALIVILLLSLGLWGIVWAVIALAVAALG